MNNLTKNIAIWLIIAVVLMTVFNQFGAQRNAQTQMPYSQFLEEVRSQKIKKVVIEGRVLRGESTDDKSFTSYAPYDPGLVSDLLKNGVSFEAKPEEPPSFLMSLLISWFPMLLLIGVWVFFMRQMQGGGKGGAFSFGKSRARLLDENANPVTFADVAGCDEPAGRTGPRVAASGSFRQTSSRWTARHSGSRANSVSAYAQSADCA